MVAPWPSAVSGRGDQQPASQILRDYNVGRTIGEGGFAKVKLAVHRITNEKVAIKIVDKASLSALDRERLRREVDALKRLRHQHISQLYEVYETEDKAYLVMEYAPRGELFDYIVARQRLKEPEARKFFRQIASAVGYCHGHNFVHRDLKPENLLLDANEDVKLIDFGLVANPGSPDDYLQTCCGSPAYAAPELIRGEEYIGVKADMWSLGVLLYALLCGFLPFDHDNINVLYQMIGRGNYELPRWVSAESAKLLSELLQLDPNDRLSIEQLMAHPWLNKGYEGRAPLTAESTLPTTLDAEVVREVATYYRRTPESIREHIDAGSYDSISTLYALLLQRKERGRPLTLPPPPDTDTEDDWQAGDLPRVANPPSLGIIAEVDKEENSTNASRSRSTPMQSSTSSSSSSSSRMFTSLPSTVTALAKFMSIPPAPKQKDPPPSGLDKHRSKSCDTGVDMFTLLAEGPARSTSNETGSCPVIGDSDPKEEDDVFNGAGGSVRSKKNPRKNSRRLTLDQVTSAVKSAFKAASEKLGDDEEKKSEKPARGSYMPRSVTGPFNADTTSRRGAVEVLQELVRVLIDNRVAFSQKEPFLLVCRWRDGQGRLMVRMEMEICTIERLSMTGIRLKRIRGDFMEYKQLCHTLMHQAQL